MHNPFLVLDFSSDPQQSAGRRLTPKTLECLCPNDNIGNAGFVFQCQKNHPFRCARTLADKDKTGNRHDCAGGKTAQLRRFNTGRRLIPGSMWNDSVHLNITRTIVDYPQASLLTEKLWRS